MIPADKMVALWDIDGEMLITRLVIPHIDTQPVAVSNIRTRAGACDEGWMRGDLINTPVGLFTYLSFAFGFKTREVGIASLHEFGKVEGQDWVADLLHRIVVEQDD